MKGKVINKIIFYFMKLAFIYKANEFDTFDNDRDSGSESIVKLFNGGTQTEEGDRDKRI
jgi:hypothetical protein